MTESSIVQPPDTTLNPRLPRPTRRTPPWQLLHLPFSLPNFAAATLRVRLIALLVSLVALAVGVTLTLTDFRRVVPSLSLGLPLGQLLLYSGFTVLRLLTAYVFSLIIALAAALFVTSSRFAETWLMPVFDILQSVPVLAFFPIAVVTFANFGFLEGAALFILLTAMIWPLLFNMIGAIRAVPRDVQDASHLFGARGFKYVRHILLPAVFPALTTGSILALGAGWNIIIVAEYINFGKQPILLPGLGSLLDQAAYGSSQNTALFVSALTSMVLIIVLFNRLLWHRLLAQVDRYKFE